MFSTIKYIGKLNLFNSQCLKLDLKYITKYITTTSQPFKGNLNAPARNNPIVMKLDTPEFKAILTDEVKQIHKIFIDHGFEIRIAGGAVRDLLLGIQPKDLDFATTATPQEMKEMFNKLQIRMFNERGEKHGTISVRLNDKENFEITTLRIDVSTDGRHAEVQFTKDWLLDANRRDLTINSMYVDLDGTVYDYFYGYDDLKKRRVVFVGDADKRITEDYLRILRYFRFYGRIAEKFDNHDQDVLEALKRNADGLAKISGERIWTELNKILNGNFAGDLFSLIINLGLGPYIGLPEKCNLDELKIVWNRLKMNELPYYSITLLCAALNSSEEFKNFNDRAKLSVFDRELGYFIIENRGDKIHEKPLRPYQTLLLTGKRRTDHLQAYIEEVFKYRGDLKLLEEFKNWTIPNFPVTGHMLIEHKVTGKLAGLAMERLKNIWIENDFQPTAKELISKNLPDVLDSIDLTSLKKQPRKNVERK